MIVSVTWFILGMVNYHGYGVVDIVQHVADTEFTLVKCLNTWGRDGEWKGDWSDGSYLWKDHPEVAEVLDAESKNDGMFWIDIKDFHQAFCLYWVATPLSEDGEEYDEYQSEEYDEEDGKEEDYLGSVKSEKTDYKSETVDNSEFKFKIINDSDMDFKLYWIGYDGLEVEYATIMKSKDEPMSSFNGHVWNLKNCYYDRIVFSLGERLFEKSDCEVLVSDMMGEYC